MSKPLARSALVGALLLLPSCGGGGGTGPDDAPASLSLAPDTLRMSAGDTLFVTATVRDASGSTLSGVSVTFAAADPAVAGVDASTGRIVARRNGVTTITGQVAPGGAGLTKSVRVEVGTGLPPANLVGGYPGFGYADEVGPAPGGGGPYTYSITGGSLPTGLTLNSTNGEIRGTAGPSGVYFFEVTATNSVRTLAQRYAITITTQPASEFNIWVSYNGGPLPPMNAQNALTAALSRWEDVITGDAGSSVTYPPTGLDSNDCQLIDASLLNGAVIEDIAILVSIGPIDGLNNTLAQGGPCGYGRQQRPAAISGQMKLDEVDAAVATPAFLRDVIWHEIAHVLGVGTLWQDSTRFAGTDSVRYFGLKGNQEWRAYGGPADGVWIQPNLEAHWDEGWFDAEIMTPQAEGALNPQPISRMTIGVLLDLGFSAVLAAADAYTLPLCRPGCTAPQRAAGGGEGVPDYVIEGLKPLPRAP